MKGVDRVVAHSTYYITKQSHAPRGVVFSMYFITSFTSEYLLVYNLDNRFRCFLNVFRYNTAALPC